MYCRNCGRQIGDQDKYCIGCGTGVSDLENNHINTSGNSHTQYFYKTKQWISTDRLVTILIGLGAAALNVIMFLTAWISVPMLSGWDSLFEARTQSEFTLLEIYSFANKADSLLDMNETAWMKFISLVILLLTIVTIVCFGLFCFKLITDFNNSLNIGKASFTLSIGLPIFIYILVYMVNKQANSGLEDTVISVLETTFCPFVVLLTGVIGKYKLLTMTTREIYNKNRNYGNISTGSTLPYSSIGKTSLRGSQGQSNLIECDKCGEEHAASRTLCPKCGYSRN